MHALVSTSPPPRREGNGRTLSAPAASYVRPASRLSRRHCPNGLAGFSHQTAVRKSPQVGLVLAENGHGRSKNSAGQIMVEPPYSVMPTKPVEWMGSSLRDLRALPGEVRETMG